jgi:hypothetical protein
MKILDYQLKIQDFTRQMSNNSKILDYQSKKLGFSLVQVENLAIENPSFSHPMSN